jgi:hypothetical protein
MKNIILKSIMAFALVMMSVTGWGQAPVVQSEGYDPANNSSGVALDKVLKLSFDRSIGPRTGTFTLNGLIRVSDQSGTIGDYYAYEGSFFLHTYDNVADEDVFTATSDVYIENGNVLVINLPDNFSFDASCYVEIGTKAIYSTTGTITAFAGITNSTTWCFSTISSSSFAYTIDYPQITSITGTSAYINSSLNKVGKTYYVALPATEPAPTIAQVINGTDSYNVTVDASRRGYIPLNTPGTASNEYINTLSENTSYKVYCVSQDANNNNLEPTSPTELTFTTLDNTAPTITFDPLNNAIGVPTSKVITVTFNEAVRNIDDSPIASDPSVLVRFEVDGIAVPSTKSWDNINRVITITPTPALTEGRTYYLTIYPVEDYSNNATNTQTVLFETSDVTPPLLSTSVPGTGTSNVAITTRITLTYNESVRNIDASAIINSQLSTLVTTSPSFAFTATIDAAKKVITIIPSDLLIPSTLYTISVGVVEDSKGNEQTTGFSITFTTGAYNVWEGVENSTWTNVNNFKDGVYTEGASVIINNSNNNPIISTGNIIVPELIIKAGGGLELGNSANLTINNRLDVFSSNISEIGNGSMLIKGYLTVNGSNVYFHQKTTSTDHTYHISSPVAGATQTNIGCDGGIFEKTTNPYSWSQIGANTMMNTAQGYGAWGTENSEWLFSGPINNDPSYVFNAVRTTKNFGWNLAGNPYPCSIDWDLVTKDNVNTTIYIWKDDTHSYGTYNSEGGSAAGLASPDPSLIPSIHAFFIQVPIGQTSGSITIPSSARYLNEYSYMKAASKAAHPVVHLAAKYGDIEDETTIAFIDGASDGFDMYDSQKMFSTYDKVIDLFSIVDDSKVAINGLSVMPEVGTEIAVGYDAPSTTATYEMLLKSVSGLSDNVSVVLVDSEKGVTQDLKSNSSYSFKASKTGLNNTRFKLQFVPASTTGVNTDMTSKTIPIYTNDKTVYVNLSQFSGNFNYELSDINGRVIQNGDLQTSVENQISVFNSGVYMLKIVSNEWVWSQKVLIKQ